MSCKTKSTSVSRPGDSREFCHDDDPSPCCVCSRPAWMCRPPESREIFSVRRSPAELRHVSRPNEHWPTAEGDRVPMDLGPTDTRRIRAGSVHGLFIAGFAQNIYDMTVRCGNGDARRRLRNYRNIYVRLSARQNGKYSTVQLSDSTTGRV